MVVDCSVPARQSQETHDDDEPQVTEKLETVAQCTARIAEDQVTSLMPLI